MSHDQQYPVVNQPQAYGAYGAPTSPSPQQHLMGPPQHVGGKVQHNHSNYKHNANFLNFVHRRPAMDAKAKWRKLSSGS